MKFFAAFVLMALVAVAVAEEPARKLEPVKEVEPSLEAEKIDASRNKRGFVLGAYTAPVAAAAVEVAAPLTAAYSAPVAYTYGAGLPYAYAPYYSYPAVYV